VPLSRLILVVAGFYPDSVGGAERQALILARALKNAGVDVTIVAPSTSTEAPLIEDAEFGRIERFRVGSYPNKGGRHILSTLRWAYWFRKRFGGRIGAGVPVYCFHARLHALGPALAAIKANAPLMIKLGGGGEASDFAALRSKRFLYGRWVQNLLLRRTDCFVANSGQIVEDLKALGIPDDRIAAFPNGVVLPDRDLLDGWLEARSGDRFIYSGRMVADKRVDVLHMAARSLAVSARPPRLVLLGDGPEHVRLKAMGGTPEEEATTLFRGLVLDVYPELAQADFFVSASLREGQSNALLEAMSAGVIPIVAEASGVTEVIDDGRTGFIVRDSGAEAFAEAMRHAITLPADRRRSMALAARQFAEDHIGIDAIAAQTISTLQTVMTRRLAQ
jgi:glycosyltransferase involved in cell wall biosynthesis